MRGTVAWHTCFSPCIFLLKHKVLVFFNCFWSFVFYVLLFYGYLNLAALRACFLEKSMEIIYQNLFQNNVFTCYENFVGARFIITVLNFLSGGVIRQRP